MANLCSATKIYERLILQAAILQAVQETENDKEVDLTGENQHGFKRSRSTSTVKADP